MPIFDDRGFRRLQFTTSVDWLEEGFNALLKHGIERRPNETDDELAKRVALAKEALK